MEVTVTPEPRIVYRDLLDQRQLQIARCERRHRLFGYAQLAAALAGIAAIWWAIASHGRAVAWIFVPLVAFVVFLVMHERVLKELEFRRRAARYFEKGLTRLDGNWIGTSEQGAGYLDPEHPYALDLDLFGKGSVFELISKRSPKKAELM